MINKSLSAVKTFLAFDVLPREPLRVRKRAEQRALVRVGAADAAYHDNYLCPNCKHELSGVYCPQCGQRDDDLRRPIWSFLADLTDNMVSPDSRAYLTFIPLIFMPGVLTRRFVEGKRARYIPPIRLYLISTLIFFLTVSLLDIVIVKMEFFPQNAQTVSEQRAASIQQIEAQIAEFDAGNNPDFEAAIAAMRQTMQGLQEEAEAAAVAAEQGGDAQDSGDGGLQISVRDDESGESRAVSIGGNHEANFAMFAPAELSEGAVAIPPEELAEGRAEIIAARDEAIAAGEANPEERNDIAIWAMGRALDVLDGLQRVSANPAAINSPINDALQLGMILLLPLFAIVLRIFYWGRNMLLMNNLVFSLHFHAFIFLLMTFFVIAQAVLGTAVSGGLFAIVVPVYLFIGLKVVSGQGWFRTSFKFIGIGFIYSLILLIAVTGMFLQGLASA